MRTTDDDIDKLISSIHGANCGRALSQRIYIIVGAIMHPKALHFELNDRNKCYALLYVATLAAIYTPHLIVMGRNFNQDACNTKRLKETSLPELMLPNLLHQTLKVSWTTSNQLYLVWMGLTGFPFITFSERLEVTKMITRQLGGRN